jgi:hypothetical protein
VSILVYQRLINASELFSSGRFANRHVAGNTLRAGRFDYQFKSVGWLCSYFDLERGRFGPREQRCHYANGGVTGVFADGRRKIGWQVLGDDHAVSPSRTTIGLGKSSQAKRSRFVDLCPRRNTTCGWHEFDKRKPHRSAIGKANLSRGWISGNLSAATTGHQQSHDGHGEISKWLLRNSHDQKAEKNPESEVSGSPRSIAS